MPGSLVGDSFVDREDVPVPPHSKRDHPVDDQTEGWTILAEDGPQVSDALAASPLAIPAFMVGWVTLGVFVALALTRRGHDRRTMVAVGAGLGPLMLVVAADMVRWREREARLLELEAGADHGGELDIVVLVQAQAEHVRSVVPTLDAVESEIGRLTLARMVDYEWLEGDPDNEVITAACSVLVAARHLVPISSPALVVCPGTAEQALRRLAGRGRRTLVLVAIDETAAIQGLR